MGYNLVAVSLPIASWSCSLNFLFFVIEQPPLILQLRRFLVFIRSSDLELIEHHMHLYVLALIINFHPQLLIDLTSGGSLPTAFLLLVMLIFGLNLLSLAL